MAATAGPKRSEVLRDVQGWHTEAQSNFDRALAHALLDAGAIDARAHADAVTEQFVAGGALGLVLWELGMVDPQLLSRTGAGICRLPLADGREVAAGAASLGRLLPEAWLVEAGCVPFRRETRRLHVATCWPWRIDRLDELRLRTALDATPHYLADVELMRLLARVYSAGVPRRYLARPHPLRSRTPRASDPPAAAVAASDSAETAELTTEEEFLRLYAGDARAAGASSAGSRAAVSPDEAEAEIVLESDWAIDAPDADRARASASPTGAAVPGDSTVLPIETRDTALALLDQAWDRQVIGDVLVRFGRSRAARVALFSCRDNVWLGWTGSGAGIDPARVAQLMVPAVPGTVFGLVAASTCPYLGPLPEHPVHRSFLAALGNRRPASVGLFPVRHRGRLLLVLYLDGGHAKLVSPDVSDMLIVAQRLPAALERIVAARS